MFKNSILIALLINTMIINRINIIRMHIMSTIILIKLKCRINHNTLNCNTLRANAELE